MKTGDMKNSFEVAEHGNAVYEVGTNVNVRGFFYPVAIEFGTKKMKKRSFFLPAMDDSFPAMKENWKTALAEALNV